jgi:ribokinase
MLAELVGAPASAAVTAAGRLADSLACQVVATLGRDGAIAIGPDGAWRADALAVEARDTTGAGDTFVGAFAAALDRGAATDAALARASVASGLACLEMGAQHGIPSADMIDRRLGDIAAPRRI